MFFFLSCRLYNILLGLRCIVSCYRLAVPIDRLAGTIIQTVMPPVTPRAHPLARCYLAISSACLVIPSARAETLRTPLVPQPLPFVSSGASLLCHDTIQMAELQYHLPHGLLLAIGRVETGRPNPVTNQLEPWPWAVQAEGEGHIFNNKADAVHWVEYALARGLRSIDVGCMQVNLLFHPDAFASLDQAFDPRKNVDYAARFLLRLYSATGQWQRASGFYHSQDPTRAAAYQQRVWQIAAVSPKDVPSSSLSMLRLAWLATLAKDAAPTLSGKTSDTTRPAIRTVPGS